MNLKLIPVQERLNKRCYFCGTNKSVKYEAEITSPISRAHNKRISICVCNVCALIHNNELIGRGLND